jgi:hypothetical protein
VCARARARATSICVRENLHLHFLIFVCVCMQQGRHIARKFESGWEVGVIKAFDKKGPSHWQIQRGVQGSSKLVDSLSFASGLWKRQALGSAGAPEPLIPLEDIITVSAGGPNFCCVVLLKSL